MEFHDIPPDLIINWDQTGINYVPVGHEKWKKKGLKESRLLGLMTSGKLRQSLLDHFQGSFYLLQLIYKGKTRRCLPTIAFPTKWHVTCSENHWANEETMKDYLAKILIPYISEKQKKFKLPSNQPALVIFGKFTRQGTENVLKCLSEHNIIL